MTDELQDRKLTDDKYWKQFERTEENGDELGCGLQNHDISMDVQIKFRGLNKGVIFETAEKGINCNVESLITFFNNIKRIARMLDESISDKETTDGGFKF